MSWMYVQMLAVVLLGMTVRQTVADPHHYKVYKGDYDPCTTTVLYTKGEVTKTVHQARYVITSTETVYKTDYDHDHYGHTYTKDYDHHGHTETVYKHDCDDDHTHTKYVVKAVPITDAITKYHNEYKTVTHLKETTRTVTKTYCGYRGYKGY